jgi:hypothetical protein
VSPGISGVVGSSGEAEAINQTANSSAEATSRAAPAQVRSTGHGVGVPPAQRPTGVAHALYEDEVVDARPMSIDSPPPN